MQQSRLQLPLAPTFAVAAHGAQGQALQAAIVDLGWGSGVSVTASYVAMTRIRRREDLLTLRAFARTAFTQGPLKGPSFYCEHNGASGRAGLELKKSTCPGSAALVNVLQSATEMSSAKKGRTTMTPSVKLARSSTAVYC